MAMRLSEVTRRLAGMPVTAPYGSWPSPVSTDLITSDAVGLVGGCVDGDDVYWVESHASQKGEHRCGDLAPTGCGPS